ncbi:MAG: quinolinate synthase NadA [Candidatus Atribacteria bacterium]|nr:quinolinate synthase NadA [Candidatus Atribacteria bacterium]MCD6350075.1 quinolinate synthase NadA [Candidatus Atribacteria bacterium]
MKDLIQKIQELKIKKNAVILAHNYQLPEVQDVADFTGDSLGLSIQARDTQADIIVFCGVRFMAETAKIISPHKKVLLPRQEAGCPMADMIDREALFRLKEKHPEAKVLCYVNTSAEVKAECDLCCTSANAPLVVEKGLQGVQEIIFVPDKYLGSYVACKTGRKFILWDGYCPVHVKILPQHIEKAKKEHPQAEVLVHPECRSEVLQLADQVLSTEGMCRYVAKSGSKEFIIATEVGILHRLGKENPQKKFYPAFEGAVCEDMKLTTLEDVIWALEEEEHEIVLPGEIIEKASRSIDRMLQLR